jgi:hypothetical protein
MIVGCTSAKSKNYYSKTSLVIAIFQANQISGYLEVPVVSNIYIYIYTSSSVGLTTASPILQRNLVYHMQMKFILREGVEELLATRIVTQTPFWEFLFQIMRFEVPLQRIFTGVGVTSGARMQARTTKAYRALESTFALKWKGIRYFRAACRFGWRFTESDTFLQCFGYLQAIESQPHLERSDTILKQLRITNLIHVPILELEVSKSFSLRDHMRYVGLKGKRLPLVVSLDDAVSDILKEIVMLLIFGCFMQLLPSRSHLPLGPFKVGV